MAELVDSDNVSGSLGDAAVALEYTKNLGNFENIKLRISAGRPLRPGEAPGDALDKVFDLVAAKLVEKMAEISDDLGE